MATRSTRSSRRTEGLTTRDDNIIATTPPVNKPNHDGNLRQRPNTAQRKRPIHAADASDGPFDKKRARFAIEINSKPIIPPNTRPLVVRPHAPAAVPKNSDPQHVAKKTEQPPQRPTNHRQKITNGIKHELDRLQPSIADIKDEKRKLRSQEGARFKSELSAYFPEYDEVIGNEPKEDRKRAIYVHEAFWLTYPRFLEPRYAHHYHRFSQTSAFQNRRAAFAQAKTATPHGIPHKSISRFSL